MTYFVIYSIGNDISRCVNFFVMFIFLFPLFLHFYTKKNFEIVVQTTSSCYVFLKRAHKKERRREMRECLMLHTLFFFSLISKHTKHRWVVFESDLRFMHRRRKERKGKKKLKNLFFATVRKKKKKWEKLCIVDWRGGGTMKLIIKGYKATWWRICKHNDVDDLII